MRIKPSYSRADSLLSPVTSTKSNKFYKKNIEWKKKVQADRDAKT